jgi:hypothetical protein
MKLIVAGSTGFVATELIRQALSNPAVKSIAALARRETAVPANPGENADPTKLRSVVCDDFLHYSDSVKKELENADACIWYVTYTFGANIHPDWGKRCLYIFPCSLLLTYRWLGLSQSPHPN